MSKMRVNDPRDEVVTKLMGERDRLQQQLHEAHLQLAVDKDLMLTAAERIAKLDAHVETLEKTLEREREDRRKFQNSLMGR